MKSLKVYRRWIRMKFRKEKGWDGTKWVEQTFIRKSPNFFFLRRKKLQLKAIKLTYYPFMHIFTIFR